MNTQLQRLFQWVGSSDPNARKDWGQEKGPTEDEMVGWHHWHNGHEFEQTPRDSEGQGSLACCSPRGCKESDTTERPNNKGTHTTAAFNPVDSRAGGVEAGGQTSQEVTTAKLWHLNSEAHLPTKKKKITLGLCDDLSGGQSESASNCGISSTHRDQQDFLQGWEPPPPSLGRRREGEGANAQRPESFIFPYDGCSVVLQDKEL